MVEQTGPGDPLGLVSQLVALAGDQAETRGRVDQLTAAVEDVGCQLAELAGTGAAAEVHLSAVRAAVEELTAAVERLSVEPDRPAVWTWVSMDTDTRREALRELAGWVDEVLVGCAVGDHRPPVRQPLPATDDGFETYLTTLDRPQPAEPVGEAPYTWPGQPPPREQASWQGPPPGPAWHSR